MGRERIILLTTVLGLIIGGVACYLLGKYFPDYTARTYVQVLPPLQADPMASASAVAQKDIQYGHRLSMANLLKQQSTLRELLDRDTVRQTKWFRRFGDIDREKHKCITKAFKDLIKNLRAYAQRDSEFVSLSMTCGDAKEAADIVNTMMNLFISSHGDVKKREVAGKLTQLEAQRVRVQRDLQGIEDALEEVRRASGLTDLGDTRGRYFQHTITVRLNDLEIEQNDLTLQIQEIQAAIETLEELAKGPITVQVERQVETDPVMVVLAQQLALQESVLAGRLAKFGDNHRVVRQTREFINEIQVERRNRKAEIAEQTRQAQLRNARDRMLMLTRRQEQLQKMREEAIAKQKDLDLARAQYDRLLAIRDERRDMLDSIKEAIDKQKIIYDDPETPKVQSMGLAQVPLYVSSPKWEFYLPGGTVLGLVFGAGLAFLIELLSDLVRRPRDVSRYLHIPLLGVIPDAAEDEAVRDIDLGQVVHQAPYSIISESYRRLRANLKLADSAESLKVLLVSSGMAGDGTTTVAVNLATTLVAENRKVLLIDANFRRPSLQTLFTKAGAGGAEADRAEFGLSSLLMGLCGFEDAKRSNVIEGLDIVDSGPLPSNPAELLGSYRMEQLIKDRRKSYDYVIIDSPPVLLVSDAKVLARLVDGTVFVFNAGTTRRGAAQRTIQELRQVNARIVGCVLFAVKAIKGGYFREQFRSYLQYRVPVASH